MCNHEENVSDEHIFLGADANCANSAGFQGSLLPHLCHWVFRR